TRWDAVREPRYGDHARRCSNGYLGVGQADTNSTRLQKWNGKSVASRACATTEQRRVQQTQSSVGRPTNELPSRLDCARFVAGPQEAQYPWEAPRTVTSTVPNRAARLKALGNAVDPVQIYPLLAALAEADAALQADNSREEHCSDDTDATTTVV